MRCVKPDYAGGSIVNLMASVAKAGGGKTSYPELRSLSAKELRGANRIVLLIIDGLGAEWLRTNGEGSFLAHHTRGAITSVFPSTTAAAMTAFSTGVAPQQHGLTGWFVNFRELGMTISPLNGVTRGASKKLSPKIIVKLLTERSLFRRIKLRSIAIFPQEYNGAGYNTMMTDGSVRRPYGTLDDFFRELRAAMRRNVRFIVAYWPEFDTSCHLFGINHRKTQHLFAELDQRIAAFASRLPKGTTLLVTADHGLVDVKHILRVEDHPVLLECLSAPLSGDARVAYCYVHPSKEKIFIAYVKKRLRHVCDLKRSADFVRQGWFGCGKQHPMLQHRVGDFTLLIKPNWMICDTVLGERRHDFRGHHSGTTKEEMLVPLIVVKK